ncbi:MAG TPA: hypothetical protein VF759_08155 [Allosphingosinicella sp.]|jgi:hypothetical protein
MPNSTFKAGRAFDAGMAAFAAVSAGFVAFAMPEPLFASLVEASRLPDFVAAAQPPLGETARFAMVGAAALLTFAAIWALMAALDRVPARSGATAVPEPEAEVPRLRRADAHPDAPARRPLLARDLGEPLELEELAAPIAAEPPFDEAELRPLPGFLVPQLPDPEPTVETAPEPEAEAEAEAEPEPEAEPRPEWPPEPEPEPRPVPLPSPAAKAAGAGAEGEASLAQLVNRIESGLSRKRQALRASEPEPEAAPADQERVGHRLRSAITDLQKIAGSAG